MIKTETMELTNKQHWLMDKWVECHEIVLLDTRKQ